MKKLMPLLLMIFTACAQATPTPEPTRLPTSTPEPTATETPTSQPPTPTITKTPTKTPEPTAIYDGPDAWAREIKPVSHEINCADDVILNGYWMEWGNICVPGLITRETQFYYPPNQFYGVMSSYAEGLMERMCTLNGPCDGYRGGVALVSCAMVGRTVWLRLPDRAWSGPYLVVDCGAREHQYYHHAVMGLAVEIGYRKASEWGIFAAGYIEIHVGSGPPSSWSGGHIGSYWVNNILEWEPYPEETE